MSPLKRIRKSIFRLSQKDFAAAVGTTQASVSRLERRKTRLNIDLQENIRSAAVARGIEWSDTFFFDGVATDKKEAA